MNAFISILSLILLAYYILLNLYMLRGWFRKRKWDKPSISNVFISIVVPFRNELKNIPSFVDSLLIQKHDPSFFEVIFVDDHSEDLGAEEIQRKLKDSGITYSILTLPSGSTSKKLAISKGVEAAQGELIVTTDIDTTRGENWLGKIDQEFANPNRSFIILPVEMKAGKSFLEKFQQLEFHSLQFVTRSFAMNQNAILCNGANLGYTKETFQKLGGLEDNFHISSGDDFFLLMKMRNHHKKGISYADAYESKVEVEAEKTFGDFISQRIRWAYKSKHAGNLTVVFVAFMNTLLSLWILFLPWMEIMKFGFLWMSLLLFSIKFLGDYLALSLISKFFHRSLPFFTYVGSFLVYPFYICLIFILSIFYKPVWKGRKVH